MSIKLPPLPPATFPRNVGTDSWNAAEVRDIQREAMRVALEAAAASIQGRGHNSFEFAEIIRALKVSHD